MSIDQYQLLEIDRFKSRASYHVDIEGQGVLLMKL